MIADKQVGLTFPDVLRATNAQASYSNVLESSQTEKDVFLCGMSWRSAFVGSIKGGLSYCMVAYATRGGSLHKCRLAAFANRYSLRLVTYNSLIAE